MAFGVRSAGRVGSRPAGRLRPRPAQLAFAAGLVSVLAGLGILLSSLAPMIGLGAAPTTVSSTVAATLGGVLGSENDLSAPAVEGGGSAVRANVITDGPVDGVAFEIAVPSLGYRATVLEGVASTQLEQGPGHYPESGWPGQPGNVAVAAHNVYWLSFSSLRAGDRVIIQTRHGRFVYSITGSKVVSADDGSVLAQTTEHRLTLTTCYPLWAGAFATKRLIFTAVEVGGVA
jgi:LPXTG-site transpeptidase (sortase) family protein